LRNIVVTIAAFTVCASLAAQTTPTDCSKPAVLKIAKTGNDLIYQLDSAKPHKLFQLGEVSQAASSCSPDRMIFVVADANVPLSNLLLPGKEQITKVRYFIQYPNGSVVELVPGLNFPRLPLTPDVVGIPDYDDTPHPPIQIPRGSH
jgi:hypothetical protein